MLPIHHYCNVHSRLILTQCNEIVVTICLWPSHNHGVKNDPVIKISLQKHSHESFNSIFLLLPWPEDSSQSQHSLCPTFNNQSHDRCIILLYSMDTVYFASLMLVTIQLLLGPSAPLSLTAVLLRSLH